MFLSSNVLETKLSKKLTETWGQPVWVSILLSGFGDSNTGHFPGTEDAEPSGRVFWNPRSQLIRLSILGYRKLPNELQVQLIASAEADLLGFLLTGSSENTLLVPEEPSHLSCPFQGRLHQSGRQKQADTQACPIQWRTMASSRGKLKAITNCYFNQCNYYPTLEML